MGCGEGRLTRGIAAEAGSVLAFDPDAASIVEAQAAFPAELAERVAFQVASAEAMGSDGAELVEDVADSKRRFPEEVVPMLRRIERPLVVRERCRLRALCVVDRRQ